MSVISDAKQAVSLNKIPGAIAQYELLIAEAESLFSLDGIGLEQACKKHSQDLMYYDVMLQECKVIEETIKNKVEEVESNIYRKYNENHQKALGARDIQQYIKGDPQYVQAYEILLEVVLTRRKLEAIVEALKSMGWMIGHITKIRVAQLEHVTL